MNSKTNPGFLLRFLMLLTLGALLATPSNAQELRAKVQGSVTDASGGVLVGASVILRNVHTGVRG